MATFAEIPKRAGLIKAELLSVFGEFFDQLMLEWIVGVLLFGLLSTEHMLGKEIPPTHDLPHFFLDLFEVVIRDWLAELEIIIKAVIDGRTDGTFGIWPQFYDRCGEEVGE